MSTDTTERGLEILIVSAMTGLPREAVLSITSLSTGRTLDEPTEPFIGLHNWRLGNPDSYNRDHCLDLEQLTAFLADTQPKVARILEPNGDPVERRKLLTRLESKITKNGTVDVLRKGIKHGQHNIDLFCSTPSPGNEKARMRHAANRFSVTRQLQYTADGSKHALDLGLFINGLPVATFELKNSLTKQTVADAVQQYKRDRDPREKLFKLGRCIAHFAVDDHEVRFCTRLEGKASWFLPFNRGCSDGAGNPPNPQGLKTDYLWKTTLTPQSLTDIIENYAQKTEKTQIWPRYHQLDVVRKLLEDAKINGAGKRYLIQHSAGSGKSNSIAWLAHQLIALRKDASDIFDSIIIVTDRLILDRQIHETIRQFTQVKATVGHAERSSDLRKFIAEGKKIIISTVQKFPYILGKIGDEHRRRHFAIIIDEAHSGQGGRGSGAVGVALAAAKDNPEQTEDENNEETVEDMVNRLAESRKLPENASYFAFTATPKNKTLEIFGTPDPQSDGTVKRHPFHSYTMKQAIQENFILDVLERYTPVNSYYRLVKTIPDDPKFDTKRATKKLRSYVEGHDRAIQVKAQIMADHFHDQVLAYGMIGRQARAMVVTDRIEQALKYFHAIRDYLTERKSPYKAIVAFSGEHEYGGVKVTEASLNGFPSKRIAEKIRENPYRFLVCANKFQTGYDEPLLHTMYVDKALSGVKAVQTLSRLNRAHPKKHSVFVLDFMNDVDTIREAFSDYYRATILSEETDPDKLHDMKSEMDNRQIYSPGQISRFVELYLGGAERDKLDPILDDCVASYREDLDEDGQVNFKGTAKSFVRIYGFLASILPYTNSEWEKLSIFLNFLVPKLPAPVEEDMSGGILEVIDMDSYRAEKQAMQQIQPSDENAEIDPVPASGAIRKLEPQTDFLSDIIRQFNSLFGDIPWEDKDRAVKLVTEDIPNRVSANPAYQRALKNPDRQNAKIQHNKALETVMANIFKDEAELFKQFFENESFKKWMREVDFKITYEQRQAT